MLLIRERHKELEDDDVFVDERPIGRADASNLRDVLLKFFPRRIGSKGLAYANLTRACRHEDMLELLRPVRSERRVLPGCDPPQVAPLERGLIPKMVAEILEDDLLLRIRSHDAGLLSSPSGRYIRARVA